MKIKRKQAGIIKELKQRIAGAVYSDMLPRSEKLAKEFRVNIKTLEKAIKKLAGEGIVVRKQGHGTYIVKEKTKLEDSLIELLFVGSQQMSAHPFYGEMLRGIMDGLKKSDYKLVFSVLEENRESGGLKKVYRNFTPSAAKIIIGTSNTKQIAFLKKHKTPFILIGCKPFDHRIPAVYADISKSIKKTINHLVKKGVTKIAYIGIAEYHDGENLADMEKFYAFVAALKSKKKLDSSIIVHTPPFAALGYSSMKTILETNIPQAVYVAYDHLCPGVYKAITEQGLKIPDDISVIGTDALDSNLNPRLFSIQVPRYDIGRKGIKILLDMLKNPGRVKIHSAALETSIGDFSGSIL
jgi:GntR family transcriptional regulator of arabinose operon